VSGLGIKAWRARSSSSAASIGRASAGAEAKAGEAGCEAWPLAARRSSASCNCWSRFSSASCSCCCFRCLMAWIGFSGTARVAAGLGLDLFRGVSGCRGEGGRAGGAPLLLPPPLLQVVLPPPLLLVPPPFGATAWCNAPGPANCVNAGGLPRPPSPEVARRSPERGGRATATPTSASGRETEVVAVGAREAGAAGKASCW